MINQHFLEEKIHLLVRRYRGGTIKTAETLVPLYLFTCGSFLLFVSSNSARISYFALHMCAQVEGILGAYRILRRV